MKTWQPQPLLDFREKLLLHGAEDLTDLELLAVFISSGNKKKSCWHLAQELLATFGDLRKVLMATEKEFLKINGLGKVRYLQLQALQEICRRSDYISLQKGTKLLNSAQTHQFLKRQLRDKKNETFVAIYLTTQYQVLQYEALFTGTVNAATVHIRPIIDRALQLNAAAIIFAHNHPSGCVEASIADIEITNRLREALELVDVQLLDHLIVGDNEIFSIVNQLHWPCN